MSKQRKIFIKIFYGLLPLLLLVACKSAMQPNPGDPAINEVYAAIDDGIQHDEASAYVLPSSLSQAMLPTRTVGASPVQTINQRFDLTVTDVGARTFFLSLVKDTPYNMIVSPDVSGTISLDLKNVTVTDVLNTVRTVYGYDYTETPTGFQIFAGGVQTRIFTVNYIDVERTSSSEISISSGQITQNYSGDGSSGGTSSSNTSASTSSTGNSPTSSNVTPSAKIATKQTSNFWKSLEASLTSILGTGAGRQVIINAQAGIVIVRATTLELDQIAKYLDSLENTMSRQVLLEAKIIEVKLFDSYQAGIDWSISDMAQTGTQAIIVPNLVGVKDPLDVFSNIFKLDVSAGTFSTVIELLSTQGNVQVLSSPRIATLNNQKAVIKVGFDEFFITNVSNTNTTTGGVVGENTQDIELTPFFSGIALDVTPRINADGNIMLHIHPIVSEVFDNEKSFTVGGQEQTLPLALSVIRESDSMVEARNGQVIIIGGLMEDKTEEYIGATPFARRIPFFGSFFRKTNQRSIKTELVILLKPTVIERGTWVAKLEETRASLEARDRGYYFGDFPNRFGNLQEFEYAEGFEYVP